MDMNQKVGGNAGGSGSTGWRGIMGGKTWENCNSIINKIYLKNSGFTYTLFYLLTEIQLH